MKKEETKMTFKSYYDPQHYYQIGDVVFIDEQEPMSILTRILFWFLGKTPKIAVSEYECINTDYLPNFFEVKKSEKRKIGPSC